MKKQPQVTEQTRANLRQAFWELYLEEPLEKITVKQITDRAGYNRATFYLYFKDMYDVLQQIEDELLGMLERLLHERLMREKEADFSAHVGVLLEIARRYGPQFSVLLGDRGDPAFARRFKRVLVPLLDQFMVTERALTPYEADLLREFYLSGILSVVVAWLNDPQDMSIAEFVPFITNVVLAAHL